MPIPSETFFDYDLEELMDDFRVAMTAVMKSAMVDPKDINTLTESPDQKRRELGRKITKAKAIRASILGLARELQDDGGEYLENHLAHVEALSAELFYLDAALQLSRQSSRVAREAQPPRMSARSVFNVALIATRLMRRTRKRAKEDRLSITKDLASVWTNWQKRKSLALEVDPHVANPY